MKELLLKKNSILIVIVFVLACILLCIAVFVLPDVNIGYATGDENYLSGRIKLEESAVLNFKKDSQGKYFTYVTYVNKFDDILVKKLTVNSKDQIKVDYEYQEHSTFNYKSNVVDGEVQDSELYLVIGNDLRGRVEGI